MLVHEAARQQAQMLLDALNERGPQVNLERVCDLYEIEVWELASLPGGIFAMVVKRPEQHGADIFVRYAMSDARGRLLLAHEIGHFIERAVLAGDTSFSFEDRLEQDYDLHEFFADEFAGAILLPEAELLTDVEAQKSPEEIAVKYRVPIWAAERRLARLWISQEVSDSREALDALHDRGHPLDGVSAAAVARIRPYPLLRALLTRFERMASEHFERRFFVSQLSDLTSADVPRRVSALKAARRIKDAKAAEKEQANTLRVAFFVFALCCVGVTVATSVGMVVIVLFGLGHVPDALGVAFISGLAVEAVGVLLVMAGYLFPNLAKRK